MLKITQYISSLSQQLLCITVITALLSCPVTNTNRNGHRQKNQAPSALVKLSHCPSYHDYTPQSFSHEYICSPQELANQFKYALGNDKSSFLIGASTSEHQCSKQCSSDICDWSRFAEQEQLKRTTDHEYTCDFWNNYQTYIDQLKACTGINTLRISIEWALVQPHDTNTFDDYALEHYKELIAYLIKSNITPIICFHHYTNPCWFADIGGFEKEENCMYFARYCAHVYETLVNHLSSNHSLHKQWLHLENQGRGILWATFNSPEGVAFKGYRQHEAPPAHKDKKSLYWVSHVLKNMLEGHVQAYQAIQTIANEDTQTPRPRIGFLKNITQFDTTPNLSLIIRHITKLACAIAQDLHNECIYSFFTTGQYSTRTPFTTPTHHNSCAPQSLDWIGLNYYSNQRMRLFERIIAMPTDPDYTDNSNYRIYPHGLFRALAEINDRLAEPLNIPIIVTENGIATQNHAKRNLFYKQYLHELLRAVQHNIPVRGYLTWTAFDNYEWPKINQSTSSQSDIRKYGLTTVSLDGLTLTLKPGAYYFASFAQSLLST